MNTNVDVLVVGAGPAGLTLACDLQRRGVNYRVISAAAGGFEGSRAKAVQPRTLEVLDDLGVLADLERHATLYPKLGLHVGPLTVPKTMIKTHEVSEDVPHPNTLLVAQYDTDAALRRRLAELGGAVEFDARLTAFTDGPDGVVATVEHAGGRVEEVRARYLVGADGGASTVRTGSGIDFPGTTDENDRMIVADVTLDGLRRDRWHIWPRHAGRFMALCPLPGGEFQLMLKLRPEEKADLDQDAVEKLAKDFIGRAKVKIHQIHWSSVWRPNIRLAEKYRLGRILLIGDAAHVHPPTGGQGMNTGIQDAYNLGWKLAHVLAGAPDSLLDTYQDERQPVAARVLGLSSEIYAAMSNRPLAGTKRGDEERQLTLSYAGGPLAAEAADEPETALRAGDRAPDARYVGTDGRPGRLHEVFRGSHFTLIAVAGSDGAAEAAAQWPYGAASLETLVVPDPAPGFRKICGITGPTLILVRPDGYIAAIDRDGTTTAIKQFLTLAAPTSAAA
ncbi:FAD-dependent monooxygenase [Streptosporangium canum]|uniref:FAD-dependent monooxygenase n=1 Tax=Streptosporangium canum TaxID=324952 RepID=UPI00367C0DCF